MKNQRRQFLKNVSLAAIASAVAPAVLKGKPSGSPEAAGAICDKTTADFYGEGPFYRANPPQIIETQLAPAGEPGTRMIISGRVQTPDCSEIIPDTVIDVWHADDNGNYDNSGYHLRGKTKTNGEGFYIYETIKPGKYLNGSVYRPSHIHYKITPPGFETLTTQLYFEGDPDNSTDPASSITSGPFDATSRIIPLTLNNGVYEGTFDIFVDGNGIAAGISTLHLEKGMIYQAGPNPFTDHITINYGVFHRSKVGLFVYDLKGRLVAKLEERFMAPQKYQATWQPESTLPAGHYFIALKINDLQVHYTKVIKAS